MFNISKAFLDNNFNEENFRYCFDRAASSEAKKAEETAATTASTEQTQAGAARGAFSPFFSQEMRATHLFNPSQIQEQLGVAEGGLGGASATVEGKATSEGATTRNAAGFGASLDAAARERMKAMGTASLGVANQDVMGAKQLNQAGAAGEESLYKTGTDSMLKAMGIQNEDIKTQIEAGKSGWFQNLMSGISTVSGAAKNMFGAGGAMPGGPGGGLGQ